MQTKEASQRAIIDQQFKQIADLQKINLKLRDELHGGVSFGARIDRVRADLAAISPALPQPG